MKKLFIGLSLAAMALLAACGDDDSDFATHPSGDSSSSVCEDCDESSSSKVPEPAEGSSSSVTPQSSNSETSVSSSSETKSSSSVTPQSSNSETSVSSSSTKSSSSVAQSSSSVASSSSVTYGTMTDTRNGKKYKTVKIGEQVWMVENLNYETENSYCYNDSAKYCAKYGRLYTWAAATTACPTGWHLPTKKEFETLFTAVGGKSIAGQKLKSATGWTAYGGITNEDAFAFSALPAGYRTDYGNYYYEGDYAYFWSCTEDDSNYAYFMYLYYGNDSAYLDYYYKDYGFSVRCLKD